MCDLIPSTAEYAPTAMPNRITEATTVLATFGDTADLGNRAPTRRGRGSILTILSWLAGIHM